MLAKFEKAFEGPCQLGSNILLEKKKKEGGGGGEEEEEEEEESESEGSESEGSESGSESGSDSEESEGSESEGEETEGNEDEEWVVRGATKEKIIELLFSPYYLSSQFRADILDTFEVLFSTLVLSVPKN